MSVMLFWGKAADKLGRKPILVTSLLGLSITVSLFGFSKSIWQMILFRCMAGIFSGSIVCIRAMLQELSTPRTQAQAFSYFAFAGNLGIFLGPVIGGGLSKLAYHYPDTIFGKIQFLKDYPYALPTMVSGSSALFAAIITALFVNETLDREALNRPGKHVPMSTWQLLNAPGVGSVLFIYGMISLLGFSYTAVVPVFWFTSPRLGGFGFDERLISIFLGLAGASQAIWLLFAFPPLQHRIGTGGVLRLCSRAYPFFLLLNPLCNWWLREEWRTLFWSFGPVMMVFASGIAMNFSMILLLVSRVYH
jgi:MFS family permease